MRKRQLTIDDLHKKQLEMLYCFDQFCEKNQLKYYLAYGTLLGAVREKGFIPWDDDVDIYMLRNDYDKLIGFDAISESFKIVSNTNNNGYYHPYSYCNITDVHTIMDEKLAKKPTGKGVFLDVFPVDNLPDDLKQCKKTISKSKSLFMIHIGTVNHYSGSIINHLMNIIYSIPNKDRVLAKLIGNAERYRDCESENLALLVFSPYNLPPERVIMKREWFEPIRVPFENISLIIPKGYDYILKNIYGDYMTPPPVETQGGQHKVNYYEI